MLKNTLDYLLPGYERKPIGMVTLWFTEAIVDRKAKEKAGA